MTSPTGGCHLRGGYSISLAYFGGIREVPRFSVRQAALTSINQQNLGIIQDSLGVCRFTGFAFPVRGDVKYIASSATYEAIRIRQRKGKCESGLGLCHANADCQYKP